MAVPRVTLETVKRKSGTVYRLRYNVNGNRIREIVGSDLKTALILQAQKQQELLSVRKGLPSQTRRTISLETLVDSFIKEKKHRIRPLINDN